jgi:hypothetical protein
VKVPFFLLIKPSITLPLSPFSSLFLSFSFLSLLSLLLPPLLYPLLPPLLYPLLYPLLPLAANGERLGSLQQDPSSPYYGIIVGAITFFVLLAMYTFFS